MILDWLDRVCTPELFVPFCDDGNDPEISSWISPWVRKGREDESDAWMGVAFHDMVPSGPRIGLWGVRIHDVPKRVSSEYPIISGGSSVVSSSRCWS